jgi:hypothetical protein
LCNAAHYGLKPFDFWQLSPWEFNAYLEGRQRAEQVQMHGARFVAAAVYNNHPYRKEYIEPTRLMALPLIDEAQEKTVDREALVKFASTNLKHLKHD